MTIIKQVSFLHIKEISCRYYFAANHPIVQELIWMVVILLSVLTIVTGG